MELLPVCHFELRRTVTATPIVFVQSEDKYRVVSVLALEKGKNLFISPDGNWMTDFIPATLLGYPFSITNLPNGAKEMVIREDSDIIVSRDEGEPFFDDDGEVGALLNQYKQLSISIHRDRILTQTACSQLQEFELLQPFKPKFQKLDGLSFELDGLFRVNEQKFFELEDKVLLQLRKTVAIDLIYASIFSFNLFEALSKIMNHPKKSRMEQGANNRLEELGKEFFESKEEKLNFDF